MVCLVVGLVGVAVMTGGSMVGVDVESCGVLADVGGFSEGAMTCDGGCTIVGGGCRIVAGG